MRSPVKGTNTIYIFPIKTGAPAAPTQCSHPTLPDRLNRSVSPEPATKLLNDLSAPGARPFEKKIVGVTDPRPRDELIDKSAIFPGE